MGKFKASAFMLAKLRKAVSKKAFRDAVRHGSDIPYKKQKLRSATDIARVLSGKITGSDPRILKELTQELGAYKKGLKEYKNLSKNVFGRKKIFEEINKVQRSDTDAFPFKISTQGSGLLRRIVNEKQLFLFSRLKVKVPASGRVGGTTFNVKEQKAQVAELARDLQHTAERHATRKKQLASFAAFNNKINKRDPNIVFRRIRGRLVPIRVKTAAQREQQRIKNLKSRKKK